MNSNRYYLKDYFNKTDIFKDSNSYVIDNENKTSYFLDLDCGKGNIISYHVFNGIDLQFNSFNSLNCNQLRFTPDEDLIVINHKSFRSLAFTHIRTAYIIATENKDFSNSGESYMMN